MTSRSGVLGWFIGGRFVPRIAGADDSPPAGGGEGSSTATGNAPGAPAPAPAPNGGTDDKRFTQAELDAIVKDRLERERKKADETAAKTKADAEAAAAKEQGEWKKLAEQHEARVGELEPRVQTAETERDTYRGIVLSQQQTAIDALPEPLKKLAPAVSEAPTLAEINARAAFLQNAVEAAAAFGSQATTTTGVPTTPKPANGQAVTVAQQQERQQQFAGTAHAIWGKG